MVDNSMVCTPHNIPQSVYVLLLLENSSGLFDIWPDLRDRYLGPLLQKIEVDNSSSPVITFVLESLPANSTQIKRPIVPRQYHTSHDGLLSVRFNDSPSNRLTYSKIQEAAQFITSKIDANGSVLRHIVIAAASPPLEETSAEPESGFPPGTSCWYRLADYLAKADVRCHLMLKSGQDWEGLTNLFEEMLQLQQITEDKTMAIDMHKIIVRLSSQRKSSQRDNKTHGPGNSGA
ncbi:hypothetical protein E1B28_003124 [Marasmius oreades]|uniref:Uncharacterized protein n=1 Tax=Marasmius oreades TaxID=181124 RepID=A0A9P7RLX7_9AGAR|nr:uncharacterized protein E1B28_003124 [Marasmius oreades]KAG7085568.1 hypothetical protein E1B28_003124 [Marasmius oreades]